MTAGEIAGFCSMQQAHKNFCLVEDTVHADGFKTY